MQRHWHILFPLVVLGCGRGHLERAKDPDVQPAPPAVAVSPAVPARDAVPTIALPHFSFTDVAAVWGVDFRHHSPFTPERHVHLVMGSGLGWFDFDRDGRPDLYTCQGATFHPDRSAVAESGADTVPSDSLYWNQGSRSVEISGSARITDQHYSMGVAAADFDNDGFPDLFVSGYERNRLLHNCGDGTFAEWPLPQAMHAGRLSASAAWGDIDGDGNLDLLVTNYAQLGPQNYPVCNHSAAGQTIAIACHPAHLQPLPDLLYHNSGAGPFHEESSQRGINAPPRQGLGVAAADLDQDGDLDFYVANDTTSNQLWENTGGGHFVDRGLDSGTATNRLGANEAGMGVAAGDVDGNQLTDLFVTNFYYETNTLYRNLGRLQFADVTPDLGLAAPSRLRLGFGTSLADWDLDGWLDLFVANGHIHDRLAEIRQDEPFAQLPLMFHNRGGQRFQEVTSGCGAYFQQPHVGRGSAVADFDLDGDLDLAVLHLQGAVSLLRNDQPPTGNWLRLELIGTATNRSAVGAHVRVLIGNRELLRHVTAGSSYLSCDEPTLLIGLGSAEPATVSIVWPGGRAERWEGLAAARRWQLQEGHGKAVPSVEQ